MKFTYNDLFLKILTILDYQDRENFVKGMVQRNHMEALANCIESLPKSVQEELNANPYNQELFKKYVTKAVYTEELNTVSTKALASFLQHMTPVISQMQKDRIAAVFPK